MDLRLKGRRALVTGSTAGIGLAIATNLAREGAYVIVTGRTEAGVSKAVAGVAAAMGDGVVGFAGDLVRPQRPRKWCGGIATSRFWSTTLASLSRNLSRRLKTRTGCGSSR